MNQVEITACNAQALRQQLEALLAQGVQFSVSPGLAPGGLLTWRICWPEPVAAPALQVQPLPHDDGHRSA